MQASGYFGNDKNSRPRPYFVETYIDGADLSKVLTERPKLGTTIALEIVAQLIEALRHLHQQVGIIHREIKPSNILVDKQGQVWLTDFAAATMPEQSEFNQVKRGENSDVQWNAPEYVQRKQSLFYANGKPPQLDPLIQNQQVDIFSLGVLLYQLGTGRSPFVPQQQNGRLFYAPTLRPDAFMELQTQAGAGNSTMFRWRPNQPLCDGDSPATCAGAAAAGRRNQPGASGVRTLGTGCDAICEKLVKTARFTPGTMVS